MARRLKVLVSAYSCSPRRGSEAGVGWGWVEAISRYHDLWVIAGDEEPFPGEIYRYRQEIEEELERRPELRDRMRFFFLHKPRWMKLERLWPPSYLWFYRRWQRQAYRLAAELHAQINFDLVHQLTYVGYRVPGHLWKLGTPFVWGPIGGLENTPWRFLPSLGLEGCLYYGGRNVINSLQRRFLPGPKQAFGHARGGIIAATAGIRREIHHWYGQESEVICEIGPPQRTATTHSKREPNEPLQIIWSGLHEPGKALPFLLRALALLPAELSWSLTVLGVGRCTAKWRSLAQKLGIDQRCHWPGWVPRDKAVSLMRQSHVLVITSMKDLTSTVLLEALSQGLPVICPDHCGFANVITANCGIKVPVTTPAKLQSGIAAAIERLGRDEAHRRQLAAGALRRIQDFSWDRKAAKVDEIYRRVIEKRAGSGAAAEDEDPQPCCAMESSSEDAAGSSAASVSGCREPGKPITSW